MKRIVGHFCGRRCGKRLAKYAKLDIPEEFACLKSCSSQSSWVDKGRSELWEPDEAMLGKGMTGVMVTFAAAPAQPEPQAA